MSYIVQDILEQCDTFNIDIERISKVLILHSHFDHVGVIPFLKRRKKEIEIYASSRAWEIISMPKAIETINRFSRDVAYKMGKGEIYNHFFLDWSEDINGKTISDGDIIEVGDLDCHIFETPGHSSCAISLYIPELKALFPSDSGGIPFGEIIIVSGNSNFTKYQESLEKLKELDVEYYCADHYGYVTGEESESFIKQSIISAKNYRTMMERTYRRSRDIETAAKELSDLFYRSNKEYFLTPEIMEGVYCQMIRHIAENMKI
jgi:glyoxylase-like metal-dependent hydrolase (beta-lactamase superfamily II)